MPKAARMGDIGSGHGCFPPTSITAGSPNVSIEGSPAARLGDSLAPHDCGNCASHGRAIAVGSGSVSINGKPAARVSDAIDCGGVIVSGAGTVSIGNQGPAPSRAINMHHNRDFIIRNEIGRPLPDTPYRLELGDGQVIEGITDEQGKTSLTLSGDQATAVKVFVRS